MAEIQGSGALSEREESGFPVISITGYFEEDIFSELEACVEKFLGEGKVSLIVDFSKCVALKSVAVGQFLFLTMKIVEDFQGRLFLTGLSAVMIRVFQLAAITPHAKIAPSIEEAVSNLKSSG